MPWIQVDFLGAGDLADVLIEDFGGAGVRLVDINTAPIISALQAKLDEAGAAAQIFLYLVPGAGLRTTEQAIPLITVGPTTTPSTAHSAVLNGGQGGCRTVHREQTSGATFGTPYQLRATTVGKTGDMRISGKWDWAPNPLT